MWPQIIASAVGAGLQSKAATSAARTQRRAVGEANTLLSGESDRGYGDLSGYRDIGQRGLRSMEELLQLGRFGADDFQEDPGYRFRLEEGEKAINRNALARGNYFSGGALKGLQRFNSGLASQEFGNAFDRWRAENNDMFNRAQTATGVGQRAVESGNALRQGYATRMADNIIGGGNATAAARQQRGAAQAGFVNTVGNEFGAMQDRMLQAGGAPVGGPSRVGLPPSQFEPWQGPTRLGGRSTGTGRW